MISYFHQFVKKILDSKKIQNSAKTLKLWPPSKHISLKMSFPKNCCLQFFQTKPKFWASAPFWLGTWKSEGFSLVTFPHMFCLFTLISEQSGHSSFHRLTHHADFHFIYISWFSMLITFSFDASFMCVLFCLFYFLFIYFS